MKRSSQRRVLRAAATAAMLLTGSAAMAAVNYAPVVSQVGDGASALSGAGATTTIQVYQYNVANQAAPVSSNAYDSGVPSTPNTNLVTTGSSATEGQLTNNPGVMEAAAQGTLYTGSAYVFSAGYSGFDGQTSVNNGTTHPENNRVVGYMTVTGSSVSGATIGASVSPTVAYSAGANIRGAVGDDTASNFWAAGNSGSHGSFVYMGGTSGSATQLTTFPTNTRTIEIAAGASGNQLYGAADTTSGRALVGVASIGSGTPTTSGQSLTDVIATSDGNTNSSQYAPESFVFMNDPSNASTPTGVPYNVMYIADTGSTAKGIQKWVYTGAATNTGWTYEYNIGDASTSYAAVAGQQDGSGNVVLYGVTLGAGNSLEQFTDPLSALTAPTDEGEVVLATAGADYSFRGVALAPVVPEPASLSLLAMGGAGLLSRRRRR